MVGSHKIRSDSFILAANYIIPLKILASVWLLPNQINWYIIFSNSSALLRSFSYKITFLFLCSTDFSNEHNHALTLHTLKSYQSLFLVSVSIRFCSIWKALSNHMKTSPMAYHIHTTKDKITANGIFDISLYRNKMESCAFHDWKEDIQENRVICDRF